MAKAGSAADEEASVFRETLLFFVLVCFFSVLRFLFMTHAVGVGQTAQMWVKRFKGVEDH